MKQQGKACQADPILCRVSYVEAAQIGLAWCQTTAGVFTHTLGQGGPTKRCRRPMVLKRRYVRERLASECTTKGLRCMKGRRSTCTCRSDNQHGSTGPLDARQFLMQPSSEKQPTWLRLAGTKLEQRVRTLHIVA